jgi:hypothetical protein
MGPDKDYSLPERGALIQIKGVRLMMPGREFAAEGATGPPSILASIRA